MASHHIMLTSHAHAWFVVGTPWLCVCRMHSLYTAMRKDSSMRFGCFFFFFFLQVCHTNTNTLLACRPAAPLPHSFVRHCLLRNTIHDTHHLRCDTARACARRSRHVHTPPYMYAHVHTPPYMYAHVCTLQYSKQKMPLHGGIGCEQA